ncbi:MAG: type II toxin-antitoxin system VapC family toxin [Pyrinomonadaceae bacterium]
MKIYFDNCSLQRPLDDQSQPRIFLESKAVSEIFSMCESDKLNFVSSEILEIELNKTPNPKRRKLARKILALAVDKILTNRSIVNRAAELEKRGFAAFDALHIASAEAAQADYFCTCDDKFLKRAKAQPDLKIRVSNPLELAQEIL